MKGKLLELAKFAVRTLLFLLDLGVYYLILLIKGKQAFLPDIRGEGLKKPTAKPIEGTAQPNHSPVYRSTRIPNADKKPLLEVPMEGVTTIPELFRKIVSKSENKVAMGSRKLKKVITEQGLQIYEFTDMNWITYKQMGEMVDQIARGILNITGLNSGDKFGLYENTCLEWFLTAQACLASDLTLVTVYATLGEEGLVHAMNQTNLSGLLTNESLLPKFVSLVKLVPSLKFVVYVKERADSSDAVAKDVAAKTGLTIISFDELLEHGKTANVKPLRTPAPESDALIMYTSGTTGIPKGCVITHRNVLAAVAGVGAALDFETKKKGVRYIAFLPLAHILEFCAEHYILSEGGVIGYGTPRSLTDRTARPCGDLTLIRPTLMAGVPRVYDTLKKLITETVQDPLKTPPIRRWLFETAFDIKKKAIAAGRDTPLINRLVFKKLADMMGGNVDLLLSGGAALNADTQEFLRICFCATAVQGYGLTETCASLAIQAQSDAFRQKLVGNITPANEVKLVSVPEMGYNVTDKPPRGEVWTRGPIVIKGYYKDPKATSEAFLDDGWFATGDIGVIHEDGALQIVDRKKNLVKLDHGEYVALEKLEGVYGNSHFVSPNGVCIYGDSSVSYVTALVLPQKVAVLRWAKENGIEETNLDTLYGDKRVRKAVLASLKEEAKKSNLSHIEIVQNVVLLNDEWTPDNEMLTAAMKLLRRNIVRKYDNQIKQMYTEGKI